MQPVKYVQYPNAPYDTYYDHPFSTYPKHSFNWRDANRECQKMGASLATVDSMETLTAALYVSKNRFM